MSRPVCVAFALFMTMHAAVSARESDRLDDGWIFHSGDLASARVFESVSDAWRVVSLPHDWSIALPISHDAPSEGHGGFFPGGIAWYRRTIDAPPDWNGRHVEIEFEGAYGDSQVWLNGVLIGSRPFAYTPFRYDLTPHLKTGAPNVLAVRVDNSAQPNSRWYTGSGLGRPVWLHVSDPVHFAPGGLAIFTRELTDDHAQLHLTAEISNATQTSRDVAVEIVVFDPAGRRVASGQGGTRAAGSADGQVEMNLSVQRPRPWTPDTPSLYRAQVRLIGETAVLDEREISFGVRTIRVTAGAGFELNGKETKLVGGNVHHDTGVLGGAAFDRAEERKVEQLKAAGFNAVRTAHNPPSTSFLEACDRLGLLVMDEIFDGWEKAKTKHDQNRWFGEWWRSDVETWVRRDRNHPSVVVWSAGNEMYERGTERGRRIARDITELIRTLDTSRPLSAGINGMGANGDWTQLDPLFATFDIAGYNYELTRHAEDHARLPQRIVLATESYQSEVFANWVTMQANTHVIGDFVWSALDYLGEAGIGRVFAADEEPRKHWEADMYPWHGAYCGDIDLTGWRKPISHYRQIVWNRGQTLYAAVLVPGPGGSAWNLTPWSMPPALPCWTWPGREGEPLRVEVYSRHEATRIMLNGETIGEKPTTEAQEFRAVFEVPYAAGDLRVDGLRSGRVVETVVLKTAEEALVLSLEADRRKLEATGQDLAFVTIEARDRRGTWNPHVDAAVSLTIEGPGRLAGFGTGDMTSMESYQASTRNLFQGRALAVIRTTDEKGTIVIHATVAGAKPVRLSLDSK